MIESRSSKDNTLYPVTIVSTQPEIHYLGYSSAFDEWRHLGDLVQLDSLSSYNIANKYDFNQHLAIKIKSSLTSQRKVNPSTRLELMFDKDVFEEGLKLKGVVKTKSHGIDHYTINSYSDLDSELGHNWHYRGSNSAGDFCYVIQETVEFYLYRKRPLVQYIPDGNQNPLKVSTPQGYYMH